MKIKVCGMKMPLNMAEVDALPIDLMGFIFAAGSPRYVGNNEDVVTAIKNVRAEKVGVFVNATEREIRAKAEHYQLDTIQLHGEESPELVNALKGDFKVIKAIAVGEGVDESELDKYAQVDYLLFDTKGPKRGGNGVKFNWEALNSYSGHIPFYLSGGVALEDASSILTLEHPGFVGVDINSRFEVYPGFKKVAEVEQFVTALKKQAVIKSI